MSEKIVKADIESTFEQFHSGKPEQQILSVPYTDQEIDYRGYLISRLEEARDSREGEYKEFDDFNYSDWYDDNAKAANSYNPPKANKQDTRIVTGTTLEKGSTLLSALLNYNLEPDIIAYDKNDVEIQELGNTIEDLVDKSRGIEHYEEKRPLLYKELLDQGTAFVEEIKVENIKVEKKMKGSAWKNGGVRLDNIKWETKLKKMYAQCEVNLLEGKAVYLGNIREFFLEKQPFAFIYDKIPYDEAKYIYGDWERFEFVPRKMVHLNKENLEQSQYRDWTLQEIESDLVEVIKYQDPLNNEFMIILNGVMMLPVGFPLTAISPSGRYTFAKGDVQPISKFFAYSKSIPAKTKVDQATVDEMLRLILLKTKQSFMPPIANKSNKVLSSKIFYPGQITQNISADDIQPIGDFAGVSAAEFNAFELMKRLIDEKSVSPTFGGDAASKGTTATEIDAMQKQQMMKMGATMLGVIALERQLVELRIHNILATWTEPIDTRVDEVRGELEKIYRTVSIKSTFENGQKGEKIFDFDPRKTGQATTEQIREEEEKYSRQGRNVRIVLLDPEMLRSVDTNWQISITPTQRDSSQLDRVLFVQNLQDAMNIFGPQSINMEHAKERFAILAKEDPNKFFAQGQPAQQQQPGVPGAEGGGSAAGQIKAGSASRPDQPSINTLSQ